MGPHGCRAGTERPGRLLVVTADDFGLTARTSRAIVDAHRFGIVTAASVLGNGPATPATLGLLDECPDLEVGVHVALVGEDPPVSPASAVPTLVDRQGRLRSSWRRLLAGLAAGRVDPDDVRREIDAQIAVVRSGPRAPTHLNLHQHLQLWPSLQAVVVDAAVSHRIGFVRTPRSSRRGPRAVAVAAMARRLARTVDQSGCSTTDAFLGLDEAGGWTTSRLCRAISTTEADRVEINVHPGAASDPDRSRYAWGYAWARELASLVEPATLRAAQDAGFRLVGPSAIQPGRA